MNSQEPFRIPVGLDCKERVENPCWISRSLLEPHLQVVRFVLPRIQRADLSSLGAAATGAALAAVRAQVSADGWNPPHSTSETATPWWAMDGEADGKEETVP